MTEVIQQYLSTLDPIALFAIGAFFIVSPIVTNHVINSFSKNKNNQMTPASTFIFKLTLIAECLFGCYLIAFWAGFRF